MGNRNTLKEPVLVYLLANMKVCDWDSSYAWIIELA